MHSFIIAFYAPFGLFIKKIISPQQRHPFFLLTLLSSDTQGYHTLSKREQDSININTNASQLQRERQVFINKVLDETSDNIKKTANEAKKDISTYAEQFTTLQERAIDTARDIVEGYIELQREIINSFNQFVWNPYLENVENRTTTAIPEVFSLQRTEAYTNTIKIVQIYSSAVADNYITTTRLAHKAVFTHAELINTSLRHVSNNAKEYSRMGINAAKNFHEAANEAAKIGISAVQQRTTVSTQKETK